MEREAISHFEGKLVKIQLYTDFGIVGTILKVYNESILFRTEQADSVINLTEIKSVVGRTQ